MADSVRVLAFVLLVVGGVLAVVGALRPLLRGFPGLRDTDLVLVILGGAVALLAAARGWKGSSRDGGVLGAIAGVILLLAGNDLAGALALVGGVLYLVR